MKDFLGLTSQIGYLAAFCTILTGLSQQKDSSGNTLPWIGIGLLFVAIALICDSVASRSKKERV